MAESNTPICFQCGQASRFDRFNRLPDGRQCPACVERLLVTLPSLLPSAALIEESEFAANDMEPDHDGDNTAA